MYINYIYTTIRSETICKGHVFCRWLKLSERETGRVRTGDKNTTPTPVTIFRNDMDGMFYGPSIMIRTGPVH